MSQKLGKIAWVLGTAILLFGLQYGAFSAWNWKTAAPHLMMAMTVVLALSLGVGASSLLALCLGFAADVLTGCGLGMNMLVLAGMGAVSQASHRRAKRPITAFALGALGCILARGVEVFLLYLERISFTLEVQTLINLGISALTTGLIAMVLHLLLYRRLAPKQEPALQLRFNEYHQ